MLAASRATGRRSRQTPPATSDAPVTYVQKRCPGGIHAGTMPSTKRGVHVVLHAADDQENGQQHARGGLDPREAPNERHERAPVA